MTSSAVTLGGQLLGRFVQVAGGGPQLTAAEREELSRVTHIGEYFLGWRAGLTELDLSSLHNVTRVGEGFLYWCSGLTELDLSPLRDMTSCGRYFLAGCTGLEQIDLSGLRSVTKIGGGFLRECHGLTELASSRLAKKLGWNGGDRDNLAQLVVAYNRKRNPTESWHARKVALLIRNFAPRDHAIDALKIWNVMRCVVRFLSPLRVPDAVLIAEEQRVLDAVAARTR